MFFIDFKAIMYPTLFAGRVGMISSAVEGFTPAEQPYQAGPE